MGRPYALLRAGFPYNKTIGMRRTTNFPMDFSRSSDGTCLILSRGENATQIRKLSWDDDNLGAISSLGMDEGKLYWPASMVIDDDDVIYVSDEATHRISKFDMEGEYVGCWGEQGRAEGMLDRPAGLALDADQNMYVADGLNHRVQLFTREGEFIRSFGEHGSAPGQFDMPWGVTVDEEGYVYVADWRNDRVAKLTPEGDPVMCIGRSGTEDGLLSRPAGVAVDAHGDIYVADWGNNRVQLFDQTGRYVEKFIGDATLSKSGISYMMTNAKPMRLREMARLEEQKRFGSPTSVHVDAEFHMFVTDYARYRVQIYKKEAYPLNEGEIIAPLNAPTLQTT
jgi:DNA-binding beta-propeller fold protein YncE